MIKSKVSWVLRISVLILVLLNIGLGDVLASSHKDGKTTANEVKEEALETYEALKNYTLEQRKEAMGEAKEMLNRLDARIAELQQSLDEGLQDMSNASRKKTRQTLNMLQKQRENVAEWYGGMQHSSSDAWEDVKKGFADSYDRLEETFDKARSHFEQDSAK